MRPLGALKGHLLCCTGAKRFDLTCHQNPQCNIAVTRGKLFLWSQILPLSVALGNPFHAPSHTLWEPLGVQYWKEEKKESGGVDKVGRPWVGEGRTDMLKSQVRETVGSVEGQRDSETAPASNRRKKRKKGRNKGALSVSKSCSFILSSSAPHVLPGCWLNTSLWRRHYHRITNTNDKPNKGTWICLGYILTQHV